MRKTSCWPRRWIATGLPSLSAGEASSLPTSVYRPRRRYTPFGLPATGSPVTSSQPSEPMSNRNSIGPDLVSRTALSHVPAIRFGRFADRSISPECWPSAPAEICNCLSQPSTGSVLAARDCRKSTEIATVISGSGANAAMTVRQENIRYSERTKNHLPRLRSFPTNGSRLECENRRDDRVGPNAYSTLAGKKGR